MNKYVQELQRLATFLNTQSYAFVDRIFRSVSLEKVSVQNFLSVVAFMGNMVMIQLKQEPKYPTPYNRAKKLTISEKERTEILILLVSWQNSLKCTNMNKTQFTTEQKRYAIQRAEFLIAAHNQLEGMLITPEKAAQSLVRRIRPSLALSLTRRCISYENFKNYGNLANEEVKEEEEPDASDSGISSSINQLSTTVECSW